MRNGIRILCFVLCISFVIGMLPVDNRTNEVAASEFFSDVIDDSDFWFIPAYWGATNNIVYGYSDGTFRPANQCTRAQMVTFIWRMAGKPEPQTTKCPFSDIKKSDYWYKAALWGNENHIVEGYKDGTFRAQNLCTRKQAVTFLWRFAGKPDSENTNNTFSDVKMSDYFYKAVLWASDVGIVAGYKDGTFKPSGNCLRRQMVTFLYKFCKCILNEEINAIAFDESITLDVDIDYISIDRAKSATPTPTPIPKPKYKAGKRLGKLPEKQRGTFSLEGKSASDILKMLKSYSKVSTGDVISKYQNKFPVKPDYTNDSGSNCEFKTENYYSPGDDDGTDKVYGSFYCSNCFARINCRATEEMNGKFTVNDDSIVYIVLYLDDYDVAAELYDKVFKLICQRAGHDDRRGNNPAYDRREGTDWSSYSDIGRVLMYRAYYTNDYHKGDKIQYQKIVRYQMEIYLPIIDKSK